MLDVRYSHLYFYQSLNRLQRGLSAIAELLVLVCLTLLNRIQEFDIFRHHNDPYNHLTLCPKVGGALALVAAPLSLWLDPAPLHVQQKLFVRFSLLVCQYFEFKKKKVS